MTAVQLEHGARTDVGRVREVNEDAYLAAWVRPAGEVEGTEKPELPEADACA